MLNELDLELHCFDFHRLLLNTYRSLKHTKATLEDPREAWSVDRCCYLDFNVNRQHLEEYLATPGFEQAFRRLYPQFAHMIPAAHKLVAKLIQMHQVNRAFIKSHWHPESPQEINPQDFYKLKGLRKADRMAVLGVTEDQLTMLDDSVDDLGYTKLTDADRQMYIQALDLPVDMQDP